LGGWRPLLFPFLLFFSFFRISTPPPGERSKSTKGVKMERKVPPTSFLFPPPPPPPLIFENLTFSRLRTSGRTRTFFCFLILPPAFLQNESAKADLRKNLAYGNTPLFLLPPPTTSIISLLRVVEVIWNRRSFSFVSFFLPPTFGIRERKKEPPVISSFFFFSFLLFL